MKGIVRVVITVLAMSALVAPSSMALAQETGSGDDGGKVVFTYGDTSEPSSLNPMSGYLATEFYFWNWAYHLPIAFGVDDMSAVPDLVTDVQTSKNGMTFTYTLRDDVTWSDGQPLTADDFAFTMNMYKNNHAYLPQNYLTLLDGDVRVVNDTTVEFDTKEPTSLYSGDVPYMYTYILPKHVFEDVDKPKQYDNVPMVGQRTLHGHRVRDGAVRSHGSQPRMDGCRARDGRDHLPHLQERGRRGRGPEGRGDRLRLFRLRQRLQLPPEPAERRDARRVGAGLRRARP